MNVRHGFEVLQEQTIHELKTRGQLFRHKKSGAELLSLSNDDTNKVFGITFRTPPSDSTGIAHIMEHSVLCGSRKYPVKEPFVELLKGSLHTFLNAFTFPDKTCYPVASQNLKDFYNLIDVYLDAVLYPRITPYIFQQEGWHYEMDGPGMPLTYKGVVFNEMKGAYSSPDNLLLTCSQQSLFPDTPYGLDSGGDPGVIPQLTYEQFKDFHRRYYHPANARIYFYGNDDPEERLSFLDGYLREFDYSSPDSAINLQPEIGHHQRIIKSFPAGQDAGTSTKGMLTLNWLLSETTDLETALALKILEYILLGMAASPLRKALIDSGFGDGITGAGLEGELRQMYFSTGLKGIDVKKADHVEQLIIETLATVVQDGIDVKTVQAALNTIEFQLRENNSGHFPQGLVIMLRALTVWLYDGDPFSILAFTGPLDQVKAGLRADSRFFEKIITAFFLENLHRTTVVLKPDSALAEQDNSNEKKQLDTIRDSLNPDEVQAVLENTSTLQQLQQTPDPPEALTTIPRLGLSDLDRQCTTIPCSLSDTLGARILFHDMFTNGILYADMGLDLHFLPQQFLPYVPLFGRALLEMGTDREDFVSLSQRISRNTGGIRTTFFASGIYDVSGSTAWLQLRGKAMMERAPELLSIFSDVLHHARFDDAGRFKQILLQEKARQEQKLIPGGHQIVNLRLRAHFNEADWINEQLNGISYLLFLRDLEKKIDTAWPEIRNALEQMRTLLVSRSGIVVNITVDDTSWSSLQTPMREFITSLPERPVNHVRWTPHATPEREAMIIPSLVNYVGKGANLYEHGYHYSGAIQVITHYLRTAWLWNQVRVQGGAYGAFCRFDLFSGILTFVSYRDPNLLNTLDIFDKTASFLMDTAIGEDERIKSIIGAIGEIDTYMLPDMKGYVSMQRFLSGITDDLRERTRQEILAATAHDFRGFAAVLQELRDTGTISILGAEKPINDALETLCLSEKPWHVL